MLVRDGIFVWDVILSSKNRIFPQRNAYHNDEFKILNIEF